MQEFEEEFGRASGPSPHVKTVRDTLGTYNPDTVVEWSYPGGQAYLGILAAASDKTSVVSVASKPHTWWAGTLGVLGGRFRPRTKPTPCDVLVIDGPVRKVDLDKILLDGGPLVTSLIMIVGVKTNSETSNNGPGILPAVRTFFHQNPGWVVSAFDELGAGVITLSRNPKDLEPVTHGVRDAFAFFKAEAVRTATGSKYLPLPMAQPRIDTCLTCTLRGGAAGGNCKVCRCYLFQIPESVPVVGGNPGKVFHPAQSCPVGKWGPATGGLSMTTEGVGTMLSEAFTRPTGRSSSSPPSTPQA